MKFLTKTLLAATLSAVVLATASTDAATVIDFESDTVGTFPSGWLLDGSDGSEVEVVTTTTDGAYIGGKAIRTTKITGATLAGFLVTQPGITGLQMDVNWDVDTASTPTLQLSGWDNTGTPGVYVATERTIGFALDNDGDFEFLSVGSELDGDTITAFSADIWYRLTMTWGAPDGGGNRVVTLNGYNLTSNSSLGVVNSMTMTSAQFGVDPSAWDGVAIRMTRGTIDNITLVPEPSSLALALLGLGGLLIASRRLRCA